MHDLHRVLGNKGIRGYGTDISGLSFGYSEGSHARRARSRPVVAAAGDVICSLLWGHHHVVPRKLVSDPGDCKPGSDAIPDLDENGIDACQYSQATMGCRGVPIAKCRRGAARRLEDEGSGWIGALDRAPSSCDSRYT